MDLRETDDIDILVKQDVRNRIIRKYPLNLVDKWFSMLSIDGCDITCNMDYLDNDNDKEYFLKQKDSIIDHAIIIKWFPCMNIQDMIKLKKSMGRAKDIKDIVLLQEIENRGTA